MTDNTSLSSPEPLPKQKVILCILDGWGIAPDSSNNGISQAHLPNWNRFLKTYPHTQLLASGAAVGLPEGQMGNSEVGHVTIGSGRVVFQSLPRIDRAIQDGTLPLMPLFQEFLKKAQGKPLHLMGLCSPGGVHSHDRHMAYLAQVFAEAGIEVQIHLFLDGRDSPPYSAAGYLRDFLAKLPSSAHVVSISGRYFAMDRDQRWDRTQAAYDAYVSASAPSSLDFEATIRDFYTKGMGDEFIPPHISPAYKGMGEGDSLVMVNFRADRVRQILSALLMPGFDKFLRSKVVPFGATMGMADYSEDLTPLIPPLFVKEKIDHTLGEIVSEKGLPQLRVAETEKYAHVTFFFNGGRESPFPGEDRILIPSPQVTTYDLKPEMSALDITDILAQKLEGGSYDLIVVNYANPDMLGHTGIQPAIQQGLEALDQCLGKLEMLAKRAGYILLVTADHGNVEQMVDEVTGHPHTAHTLNSVPLVGIHMRGELIQGGLQDVAPTVLDLMGLEKPLEMTGMSLKFKEV
jgi:2,3-bisphosphoglycerate-independent phosphoglycerate mutase